ncbi:MAG: PDDEXK nuclease domain-containing protein [Verrucomicrobiales bacterium]|nr:PDDEXK nuclease domain-containing protein [Verrucomicrobiales bacterium]
MGSNQQSESPEENELLIAQDEISANLIADLSRLISETRSSIAVAVDSSLSHLYWRVGNRIHKDALHQERAEYAKRILHTLSAKLTAEYGRGWSERNLAYMVRFAETFSDPEILHTLCAKLSWSHFKKIIYLEDPLKRRFYAEMCRAEQWSTRTLQKMLDGMLYERTALSKKPDELIQQELQQLSSKDRVSPDLVFKDPYILDFLGLSDHYYEKDLEDAILRELEQFLLELGDGFAFLARQKRIQLDNVDYYIDLLFYHRGLNRLVAIDLKLGDFKPEYKGQMELYLRWLSKHERRPQEAEPLGIILCAGKKQELVELLELGQSGIHVAEYLTELPSRELLQQKLHHALQQAKQRNITPRQALPDNEDSK